MDFPSPVVSLAHWCSVVSSTRAVCVKTSKSSTKKSDAVLSAAEFFYFVKMFEMKNHFKMLRNKWSNIDRKSKITIALVSVHVIIGMYLFITSNSREITWKELTT